MKNARRPEEFMDAIRPVPVLLHGAKFSMKDGNRMVRLDFEAAAAEVEKFLAEPMQLMLAQMIQSNSTKVEFGVEYAGRLVELAFRDTGKPNIVVDDTSIVRVGFKRPDCQHTPLFKFSFTTSAKDIGHWAVDHYGDPMYFRSLRNQMELNEQI